MLHTPLRYMYWSNAANLHGGCPPLSCLSALYGQLCMVHIDGLNLALHASMKENRSVMLQVNCGVKSVPAQLCNLPRLQLPNLSHNPILLDDGAATSAAAPLQQLARNWICGVAGAG